MRASGMRKINLFLVGVQKSGTTALSKFLRESSYIKISKKEELHIFDKWHEAPRSEDIVRLYGQRDERDSDFVYYGDMTPIYCYWPPSIIRISEYNPDAKLIMMLRDPAARAFSQWRMDLHRNIEHLSFSDAIRDGRKRLMEKIGIPGIDTHIAGYCSRFSYVERGFYTEQIGRILARFRDEQILFMQTHDLRTDHEGTLDKVCDFLGVPRFEKYPEAETVFSHWRPDLDQPDQKDIDYLYDLFEGEFRRVKLLTGIDLFREYERTP